MGNYHAFRGSGRAGGIDDICRIINVDHARRIFRAFGGDLVPIRIKKYCTLTIAQSGTDFSPSFPMCEQYGDLSVFGHKRESLRRIRRVERRVYSARFEDAEKADDHLYRALYEDAYRRFRPDTEAA